MQTAITEDKYSHSISLPWNPPASDLSKKYALILLGIIFVLATGLRFFHLADLPFHGDELFTLRDATNLNFSNLETYPRFPIVYAIVKIFMLMGLDSVYALRLPFAIFGIAGVFITYWLARHFVGTLAAIGGAFLLSLHHSHLFISQEIRFYGLLYLLSALYLGFSWRAFHSLQARWAFLSGLCFGLAVITQNIAIVLILTTLVFLLAAKIKHIHLPGATIRNGLIALIPLLPAIIFLIAHVISNGTLEVAVKGGTNEWMVYGPKQLLLSSAWWISPVMIGVAFVGVFGKGGKLSRGCLYNLAHSTIGLLILFLISFKAQSFGRYITPVLPAIVMLWCYGIQNYLDALRGRWGLLLGLAGIVILPMLISTVSYLKDGGRYPWNQVANFLQKKVPSNDLIVARYQRILKYIAPQLDLIELENFQYTNNGDRAAWIVIPVNQAGFPRGNYNEQELRNWLSQHAHLVKEFHKPRYDAKYNSLRVYYAPPVK